MAFSSPHRVETLSDEEREATNQLLMTVAVPASCPISATYWCLKFLLAKSFFTEDINGRHFEILYHMVTRATIAQGVGAIEPEHFCSLIRVIFSGFYVNDVRTELD